MSKPLMLNQDNNHYLLVHVFFIHGLTQILQYGTIYLMATRVDHIVSLAS
jgi:hypothetical protein